MTNTEKVELLLSELKSVPDLEIYQKTSDLKRFSKAVSYTHLTLPTNREV